VIQCMWTGQGTVWYSVCGLVREQCDTVYVDWSGNSVVQCMWTRYVTQNIRTEEITADDIYNLYSLPHDIMLLKWRCIRWAGHVVRMKEI